MAVGSYDANGVWINGEDDTYATFSARLNKSIQSISTEIGNDRTRLTALELMNPQVLASSGKTSAMPTNVKPRIKAGRVSVTTGASGTVAAVVFPAAFPAGIVAVFLTTANGATVTPVINGDAQSVTGFTAVFPGVASGVAVVYNWLAIGW